MDGNRFDAFAKGLARSSSRRAGLRLAAGGALAALVTRLGAEGAAAACVAVGKRCARGAACCAGAVCRSGRCRCRTGLTNCGGTCLAECPSPGAAPKRPFPQHLTYANGTIRPNHRSQGDQDADVRSAYARWKERYLVRSGTATLPLYRVAKGKPGTRLHDRTVSEGQGYGMLIVPLMAGHDPRAQTIFDGLWRFARAHPSTIDRRLMSWTAPAASDSAFDGDCDMAYGLLLADAQWGSTGAIDYRAAATTLLRAILESTIGPQSKLPLLGDWTDPNGAKYNQDTPRTSDFVPGHFRAFGRFTGDVVWQLVVDACQGVVDRLQTNHAAGTGLLPDFVQPASATDRTPRPASPNFLEGANDGAYYYNAGRDPWRLGTDGLLNGDAASLSQTRKITTWAKAATGGNPAEIRAGYRLDGTPLPGSNYFTTFFAAPLGVAAMIVPAQQGWLNAVYDSVRAAPEDYFEDSVSLLCLLVMTGNFWDPTA